MSTPLAHALPLALLTFAFGEPVREPMFTTGLEAFRGRPQIDPVVEAALPDDERAAAQAEWNADLAAHWRFEDGESINDGKGVFLTTARDYGDVDLVLDWKMAPLADSGVYLRGHPQVQIWDTREAGGKWELGADRGSGGLWNNRRFDRFPSRAMDRAIGEWNRFRIVQVGARTSVWLNDEKVVDHVPMENFFTVDAPLPPRGPIQLQTHGGEMRFRDFAIAELDADSANTILRAHDAGRFRPLFDGRSLAGWSGARDGYEVEAGILRCKPGSGGTLFTEESFDDFVLRLEFRLPAGGNNGIAIRYPGHGDGAYDGMGEVQILDDSAAKWGDLADWQRCASLYGQFAAAPGHVRPPGEWNFYEITVKGSTIRVELNGTIVLDVDVASDAERPSGNAHAGRAIPRGHVGLCGHGDPVEFRNIEIAK